MELIENKLMTKQYLSHGNLTQDGLKFCINSKHSLAYMFLLKRTLFVYKLQLGFQFLLHLVKDPTSANTSSKCDFWADACATSC